MNADDNSINMKLINDVIHLFKHALAVFFFGTFSGSTAFKSCDIVEEGRQKEKLLDDSVKRCCKEQYAAGCTCAGEQRLYR